MVRGKGRDSSSNRSAYDAESVKRDCTVHDVVEYWIFQFLCTQPVNFSSVVAL